MCYLNCGGRSGNGKGARSVRKECPDRVERVFRFLYARGGQRVSKHIHQLAHRVCRIGADLALPCPERDRLEASRPVVKREFPYRQGQAGSRSMTRITAAALLWFLSSSNWPMAQEKTWPGLVVYSTSPCLTQTSPSNI